jgi:archaellum component FlaG (FlaF/FlaG flagellin family)
LFHNHGIKSSAGKNTVALLITGPPPIDLNIQNTGDIPITYGSVDVLIDGTTQTDTFGFTFSLEPGQSTTKYLSYDITVPNGNHDITIRLMNNGETVIIEITPTSTDS